MKLAEALSIRKDLQKRVEQIKARLLNSVKTQEGDEPAEQPAELFTELDDSLARLETLVFYINKTNMETGIDGRTLTELLAQRDMFTTKINVLRSVFDKATETQDRYSRTEIKLVTNVDVKQLGKQIDKLAKKLRELDYKIQSANFTTELAE
ncbi:DIP1984 family protein [Segatella buccae]|uniref:DIP1984 family protein n=1 Tax=Segatella buccae TaxID=28126 RepID=UPI0022E6E77C|nr:DIP1984 family protein [Segatella buccae]